MKEEFLEFMNFRHACKEFDINKKISNEDFEFILEVARLSPSSFGLEPWKFLVVQNMDYRDALLPVTWGGKKQLPTASHFIVTLVRKGNAISFDSDHVEHMLTNVKKLDEEWKSGYKVRLEQFQKEEFKLLESERATFDWAAKQSYIPLANMMTAASTIGIDTCPIEGFDPARVNDILKEKFKIDTDVFAVANMLALGYRKREQPDKKRQEVEDIVTYY